MVGSGAIFLLAWPAHKSYLRREVRETVRGTVSRYMFLMCVDIILGDDLIGLVTDIRTDDERAEVHHPG